MSEGLDRERWLAGLRLRVPEVAATDAFVRQASGALLVDVRDENERASGMPAAA